MLVEIDLDGTGRTDVATGVGFYDHMLTSFGKHGLFDLTVQVEGDLHIDAHHTVEDTAIALGQAFAQAAGDKAGTRRFGDAHRSRWTRRWCRPRSTCPAGRTSCTRAGRRAADLIGPDYATHADPARVRVLRLPRRDRAARASCTPAATGTTSPRRSTRRWPARCGSRSSWTRASRACRPPRACCSSVSKRVVVLDYGSGNLRSAERALDRVGADVDGDRRPGRGAGGRRAGGARRRRVRRVHGGLAAIGGAGRSSPSGWPARRRCSGICVGHAGAVRRRRRARRRDRGLGMRARPGRAASARRCCRTWGGTRCTPPPGSRLFAGLPPDTRFYFVHSYAARECCPVLVAHRRCTASRSWRRSRTARCRATQFHPEKSGDAGRRAARELAGDL